MIIKSQTLSSLLDAVETDIIRLRDAAELAFKNRCSTTAKCGYHSCSNSIPPSTCNLQFLTFNCSCYFPTGNNLSMDEALIRLADVYAPFVDQEDKRVKEMVRTGKQLDPLFIDLNDKNKETYKWMYFGSNNGVFYKFPGLCNPKPYDPR